MANETKEKRVALSGATGLVGAPLSERLRESGWSVYRLNRHREQLGANDVYWSPREGEFDAGVLDEFDAVVHLAGENIASKRWTDEIKQRIRDSRVAGTRLLCEGLARLEQPPGALVCASAIGYYGDRGAEVLTEESSAGTGFLAEVCEEWEAACEPARQAGIRVMNVRIGIVLAREGGALEKMLTPFKLGLGGRLGSGEQYMSWIALHDLVRLLESAVTQREAVGALNGVAPNPVTNAEFTKTLGRVLRRPTILPAPAGALKLALGDMAEDLLLASTRVVPQRLERLGFAFEQPELEGALRSILEK